MDVQDLTLTRSWSQIFCIQLSVLLLHIFGASHVYGRDDVIPGSRYTSARGAALGDSVTTLADDVAGALMYNPAGLGKVRKMSLEAINFSGGLNTDFINILDRNFYKSYSLGLFEPTLSGSPGVSPGAQFTAFPTFGGRGYGLGLLAHGSVTASALEGDDENLRYKTRYLFVPTLGGALRIASGVVRVGYVLQYVSHTVGDITASKAGILSYNDSLAEGAALSHNVGLAVTLPITYLPQITGVIRNVLGAKYQYPALVRLAYNSSGPPPDDPMSVDVGFSFITKMGLGSLFSYSFVYRDATNSSGTSLLAKPALGIEFSFRDQFFLRGGWGTGYPSAGIGLRRKNAEISLTWYSEEVGGGYLVKRDTRYMAQYQISAF